MGWQNGASFGANPVDGVQHIGFNGGNAAPGSYIFQTFSTTVGQTYVVSFYVGRNGSGSGTMSLLAKATSSTDAVLGSLNVIAPSSSGYGPVKTFTFTATTSASALTFQDTSSATIAVDVLLDNVSVVPVVQCVPVPSGLVSWWQAESNALDNADSNHGTLVGNAAYAGGRVGQAFTFDGNGDAVQVGNPTNLQLQNFTIEAWIKRASASIASLDTDGGEIFSYGYGGYGLGIYSDGHVTLSRIGIVEVTLSPGITDTNIHHLAVTKSGSTVFFYIDGVPYSTTGLNTTFEFTTPPAIGARGDTLGSSFLGSIDELAVFNRVLTAAEIQSIVNAGSAGKCASPPVNLGTANVRVLAVNALAGGTATVPVELLANGNENALGFSLTFDPTILTFDSVTLGNGATGGLLISNTNQVNNGKLGLAVALSANASFAAGTQQVVRVNFAVAPVSNATVTAVSFGDQPIVRQVSDRQANVLPATYTNGSVFIAAVGFEGDVSPRPNGDKAVAITDWVQAGRFVARLDTTSSADEFQRADSAPRSTLGDGALTITDWVQAGRYAAGLDPLTPIGGPTSEAPRGAILRPTGDIQASGRKIKVVDATVYAGQTNAVSVELEAQSNENALGFSLSFDASKLSFAGATLSSAATGATLNLNTSQVGSGKLGVALALSAGNSIAAGTREVVKVSFAIASPAKGTSTISFDEQPIFAEVSDAAANALATSYINGLLTIIALPAPTLKINRSDDTIILSWPLSATNFVLQGSDSLLSPSATWSNVLVTPNISGQENIVTLPLSGDTKFYRLQHP